MTALVILADSELDSMRQAVIRLTYAYEMEIAACTDETESHRLVTTLAELRTVLRDLASAGAARAKQREAENVS